MNCQAMIGVLREAGVEVRDQPVLPSALGLPDGVRTRLLVDHDGLFRVYCTEHLPSTLPMSRIKGALKAAGDEALLLMDRGGGRFAALHTTAEGEGAQAELGEAEVVRLLPNVRAVGGEDPYVVSERVRDLILHPEEEREAYQNKGLFSDDYLKHRLTDPGQYPEWREDVSQAREKLRRLYESKKEYLDGLNEARTENEFLDQALEVLGHAFVKQTRTRDGSRPDYALFGDVGAKDEALQVQVDPAKLYASSLAVAEGKYWGRNLDVYAKRDDKDNEATASQKSSPEMQIARYLQETGLSWGILTNGLEWRLYHGGAPGMTKRYYSVDLVRTLESEDLEDFRRFYLFFRRDAFVPKGAEGKSFLDRVHAGSEEYAVRVGNNLKKVVFEKLFAGLATGFLEYHGREIGQPVDEEVLKKTYRGTLALLYRLLFLLYAEARDLLPHRDRLGYGVHSITRLKKDVAARLGEGEKFSDKSYVIWERLESLFRIVDEGSPELNVPPYNGGLFQDAGSHEFLGTHRVSDRHLAPALDELSRQEVEGGERRFVDYGFIGVRELGSVYEGLLEFSLSIADEDLVVVKEKGKEVYVPKGSQKKKKVLGSVQKGDPYLVNDKKERKATGAYYTPRYIVDYIVRNTLGPLVEERREALKTRLAEVARDDLSLRRGRKSEEYRAERRREAGALRTLLDVKVLDPAMGSGHFLVAAVDYLTDEFSRIISELDAEPVVEELAKLRAEIRASLDAYGASAGDEQLSDANLLKRMVLKRCVYGVDLNEMAVELAKLSLWLDAFTVGAPLSFLDHHLKHGNSLIGSSVREVRRELEGSGSLSGTAFEGLLSGAETMHELEEIPDATITQVRESASLYTVADKILDPMKRVMDAWTSKHFDNAFAETILRDELSAKNFPELKQGDLSSFSDRGRKVFEAAADLRETKHFFHWELEFPEVFYEGARERENAGFDAVVGNPPYVRIQELNASVTIKRYYKAAYTSAGKGNYDIYAVFVEHGLSVLNVDGRLGYILPHKFFNAEYGRPLRELISGGRYLYQIVHFGDEQVFEGATTYAALLFLDRAGSEQFYFVRADDLTAWRNTGEAANGMVPASSVTADNWNFVIGEGAELFGRLERMPVKLKDVAASIFQGLVTSADSVYLLEPLGSEHGGSVEVESMSTGKKYELESKPVLWPLCKGSLDIRRYIAVPSKWVLFPYDPEASARSGKTVLVAPEKFATEFPRAWEYLKENSEVLRGREKGKMNRENWYGYVYPKSVAAFAKRKILTPSIASSASYVLDKEGQLYFVGSGGGGGGGYGIILEDHYPMAYEYMLGLLNSKLLDYYLKQTSTVFQGGYYAYNKQYIERLPIRTIDFSNSSDKDNHECIVEAVEQITTMHEKRTEIEHTWQERVEAILPPNHNLTKTFLEQGWVGVGLERGWEGVKAEFQARNAIPSGKALQDLRRETEEALEELRPLYERIQRTDELIDQIVYRLYGLTEDEIAVVEASVKRG